MELKQLYTDLILEYNKDKSNKRKIECPTVHEHGHNPSCGDDIDIEVKIKDGDPAELSLIRRTPDLCKALVREGVAVSWTYAELGLEAGQPVRVLNPISL